MYFLGLVLCLALGSCTQVYSDFNERTISLEPGDLEQGGLAFITPSTVTGQEEEKQAVALTFSEVLKSERPEIPVVPLAEVLSKINSAGLAGQYKSMYEDYRDSGLFKPEILKQIAESQNSRYLAQLKLQGFDQDEKNRVQVFGVRIMVTQQATLRLFLQIWDASDGTIAWEGVQELRSSRETITEDPVTLQDIMKRAAMDVIAKLPQSESQDDQNQQTRLP